MTDHKKIRQALDLGQQTGRIHRYYNEWSDTYDYDVLSEDYCAPAAVAGIARNVFEHHQTASVVDAQVLDAGCGTGLAGVALDAVGFKHLSGADLSPNMAAKARDTGVYRSVYSPVDLTRSLAPQLTTDGDKTDRRYDLVTCVGVFTLGHVPPSVLLNLLNITRPGGWVIATAREEYCDKYHFEQVCHELQDLGHAATVQADWGEYVSGDRALYVTLERPEKTSLHPTSTQGFFDG